MFLAMKTTPYTKPVRTTLGLIAWAVTLLLIAWGSTLPAYGQAADTKASYDRAVQTVLDAGRSDNPRLRVYALEAVQPLPTRALPMAQLAAQDRNPAVRYAAMVTIGKLELEALGPMALAKLNEEQDPSVWAASLFAAKMAGEEVNITPMGDLLLHDEPGVRGNVADLIGFMGDPSALPLLRQRGRAPMPKATDLQVALVLLQMAEAAARLGDEKALEGLRTDTYSNNDEIRVRAIQALGRLGDRGMTGNLNNFLAETEPMEIRLASAQALAANGDNRGGPIILEAAAMDGKAVQEMVDDYLNDVPVAQRDPERMFAFQEIQRRPEDLARVAASLRAQAALALADLAGDEAEAMLAKLLTDADPVVRIAAATAVIRRGPTGQAVAEGVVRP